MPLGPLAFFAAVLVVVVVVRARRRTCPYCQWNEINLRSSVHPPPPPLQRPPVSSTTGRAMVAKSVPLIHPLVALVWQYVESNTEELTAHLCRHLTVCRDFGSWMKYYLFDLHTHRTVQSLSLPPDSVGRDLSFLRGPKDGTRIKTKPSLLLFSARCSFYLFPGLQGREGFWYKFSNWRETIGRHASCAEVRVDVEDSLDGLLKMCFADDERESMGLKVHALELVWDACPDPTPTRAELIPEDTPDNMDVGWENSEAGD